MVCMIRSRFLSLVQTSSAGTPNYFDFPCEYGNEWLLQHALDKISTPSSVHSSAQTVAVQVRALAHIATIN